MRLKKLLPLAAALAPLGAVPSAVQGAQAPDDKLKDLLELMRTPVVSASKTSERLSEAPATVIVLHRSDLEQRGYTELSQILDDLPGMDVARSYGANYFKDYWRGYRNDIGEPFLVLVDGISFNHLWYNTADTPLVTYPLSAIERVEVVYGPASAVYGANALVGVINIITRKADEDGGLSVRGSLTGGSFDTRIADLSATFRSGGLSFSLAGRLDSGSMDTRAAERYEYTKSMYYSDPRVWGSIVADSRLAGRPESEHHQKALDMRLGYGNTEFGFQQLIISSGYGLAYAADESQSLGRWTRPEYSFFIRHTDELTSRIKTTSLIRYRLSGTSNDSYDVESIYGQKDPPVPAPAGWYLYSYQVLDSGLSAYQDFEIKASDRLTLNTGLKYESKSLQRNYLYGTDYTRTDPPHGSLSDSNHFSTEDRGLYAQGRFRLDDSNLLNLGLRSDYNSIYKTATTLRGGYVGSFGAWGIKALYGQGYQEPTARQLYGAAAGTGSNANLRPEKSNTAELGGSYTVPSFGVSLSVYKVENTGKIQKDASGAVVNTGGQEVSGADLGVQWIIPVSFATQWKLWGYYSRYLKAEDLASTPSGELRTRSGDLADNKFWLGTTLVLNRHFNGTLLARIIGSRPTVLSNPVREVDGYGSMDLVMNLKDLWIKGLGASLRVANLTDRAYFHPGLRDAGAGTTPGGLDAAGNWVGSKSYYNSLLPQPGRSIQFSVTFDF